MKKMKPKTFSGLLQSYLMKAKKDNNLLMYQFLRELIIEYNGYQRKTRVELESWKGKSGIKVIERPDSFITIRYQKDKGGEPKEVTKEITKEEVNQVIKSINLTGKKENIKTREIAEKFCRLTNLYINSHGEKLFFNDGSFNFDNFFADRPLHTKFNDILNILSHYRLIKYVAGRTTPLTTITTIQEVLS